MPFRPSKGASVGTFSPKSLGDLILDIDAADYAPGAVTSLLDKSSGALAFTGTCTRASDINGNPSLNNTVRTGQSGLADYRTLVVDSSGALLGDNTHLRSSAQKALGETVAAAVIAAGWIAS